MAAPDRAPPPPGAPLDAWKSLSTDPAFTGLNPSQQATVARRFALDKGANPAEVAAIRASLRAMQQAAPAPGPQGFGAALQEGASRSTAGTLARAAGAPIAPPEADDGAPGYMDSLKQAFGHPIDTFVGPGALPAWGNFLGQLGPDVAGGMGAASLGAKGLVKAGLGKGAAAFLANEAVGGGMGYAQGGLPGAAMGLALGAAPSVASRIPAGRINRTLWEAPKPPPLSWANLPDAPVDIPGDLARGARARDAAEARIPAPAPPAEPNDPAAMEAMRVALGLPPSPYGQAAGQAAARAGRAAAGAPEGIPPPAPLPAFGLTDAEAGASWDAATRRRVGASIRQFAAGQEARAGGAEAREAALAAGQARGGAAPDAGPAFGVSPAEQAASWERVLGQQAAGGARSAGEDASAQQAGAAARQAAQAAGQAREGAAPPPAPSALPLGEAPPPGYTRRAPAPAPAPPPPQRPAPAWQGIGPREEPAPFPAPEAPPPGYVRRAPPGTAAADQAAQDAAAAARGAAAGAEARAWTPPEPPAAARPPAPPTHPSLEELAAEVRGLPARAPHPTSEAESLFDRLTRMRRPYEVPAMESGPTPANPIEGYRAFYEKEPPEAYVTSALTRLGRQAPQDIAGYDPGAAWGAKSQAQRDQVLRPLMKANQAPGQPPPTAGAPRPEPGAGRVVGRVGREGTFYTRPTSAVGPDGKVWDRASVKALIQGATPQQLQAMARRMGDVHREAGPYEATGRGFMPHDAGPLMDLAANGVKAGEEADARSRLTRYAGQLLDTIGPPATPAQDVSRIIGQVRGYQAPPTPGAAPQRGGATLQQAPTFTPEEGATPRASGGPSTAAIKHALFGGLSNPDRASLLDTITAVRRAGLLTSIRTIGKITASHVGLQAVEELAKIPASIAEIVINATPMGAKQRTVVGSNIPRALVGQGPLAKGVGEALTKVVSQTREIMANGLTKEEMARLGTVEELKTFSPLLDRYISTVFRIHGAAYQPFKTFAIRRSLDEQAHLDTINGTHTPADVMAANAIHAAEAATFTEENVAAGAFQGFRGYLKHKGEQGNLAAKAGGFATDTLLPFSHVPANVISRVLDYAVVGSVARGGAAVVRAAAGRRALTPAEQSTVSMAIGRSGVGAGLLLAGYFLGKSGAISGFWHAHTSALDQSTGKTEGSVLIRGQRVKVGELSPVGNLLVMGAEEASHGVTLGSAAATGLHELSAHPLVKEATDVAGAFGADSPGAGATHFAASLAGSFVPSGVADLANAMDDRQRQTSKEFPQAMTDAIKARLPGQRTQLPAKVGVTGEAIPAPGGVAAIGPTSPDFRVGSRALGELDRLGVQPPPPAKGLPLGTNEETGAHDVLALPPEMQLSLHEATGKAAGELLDLLVHHPAYAQMDDQERTLRLHQAIKEGHGEGRDAWIQDNADALRSLLEAQDAQPKTTPTHAPFPQ